MQSQPHVPAEAAPPHSAWTQLELAPLLVHSLAFTVDLPRKITASIQKEGAPIRPSHRELLSLIAPGFVSPAKIRTDLQRIPYLSYTAAGQSFDWSPCELFALLNQGKITEEDFQAPFIKFLNNVALHAAPQLKAYLDQAFHQQGILDLGQTLFSWLAHVSWPIKETVATIDRNSGFPVYRYLDLSPNNIQMHEILSYSSVSIPNPSDRDGCDRDLVPVDFSIQAVTSLHWDPSSQTILITLQSFTLLFPSLAERDRFQSLIQVPLSQRVVADLKALVLQIPGLSKLAESLGAAHLTEELELPDYTMLYALLRPCESPISQPFLQSRQLKEAFITQKVGAIEMDFDKVMGEPDQTSIEDRAGCALGDSDFDEEAFVLIEPRDLLQSPAFNSLNETTQDAPSSSPSLSAPLLALENLDIRGRSPKSRTTH